MTEFLEMRILRSVFFVIAGISSLNAQESYFSGRYMSSIGTRVAYIGLFEHSTCTASYVAFDSTDADDMDDIALCPNGKLYGWYAAVDATSGLYEIDLTDYSVTQLQHVPLSFGIEGISCSCDTILYGGRTRMFSYNIGSGEFIDIGTLPGSLYILGDMIFIENELYASGFQNKILHIDLNDLSNSSEVHEPTSWQIIGYYSVNINCDSSQLMIVEGSAVEEATLTVHSLSIIDFQEQFYCSIPIIGSITGWAGETCHTPDPCEIIIDLDGDDSEGLTPWDFQDSTFCVSEGIPLSDTDAVVFTDKPWDSLTVLFVNPSGTSAMLIGSGIPGITINGSGTQQLTITNTGNVTPQDLAMQITQLTFNPDPAFLNQTYVIALIGYAVDLVSDTAFAHLFVGDRQSNAGSDDDVVLCRDDISYNLNTLLSPGTDDGTWAGGDIPPDGIIDVAGFDSGIYYYIVDDINCGPDTSEWSINIQELPVFDLGQDTILCTESLLLLFAPSSSNIVWQDGSTDDVYPAMASGYYWAEVTSDLGCSFRDSIFIEFVDDIARDTGFVLCTGETLTFENDTFSVPGIYQMLLPGNGNQCDTLWVIEILSVDETQDMIFSQGSLCNQGVVMLTVPLASFGSYLWSTGEMSSAILTDDAGLFDVTITYSPTCSTTASIEVPDCDEPQFFIPNVFSPNLDQINDVLEIHSDDILVATLRVFDRWGGVLYEETSATPKWDGNTMKGLAAPGVYVYTVEIDFINGAYVTKGGSVTIIR